MAETVINLTPLLGEREVCRMVGYPRASFQRHYLCTDDAGGNTVVTEAIGSESRGRSRLCHVSNGAIRHAFVNAIALASTMRGVLLR